MIKFVSYVNSDENTVVDGPQLFYRFFTHYITQFV